MKKPLIVYVSGSPGSGKTTLGRIVADRLYIQHLTVDKLHAGIRLTTDEFNDRRQTFHEGIVPLMQTMAERNISFVVDQTLIEGVSQADVIDKLTPLAEIINIHTITDDPIARYIHRNEAREDVQRFLSQAATPENIQRHRDNLPLTQPPLRVGVPQMVVDTNHAYRPSIDEIITFILNTYRRDEA